MTYFRGALFRAYMFLTTPLMAVALAPALLFGREGARLSAKIWCRAMLWGLGAMTGVRSRVEGSDFMPKAAAIVASNHQSMWETLFLFATLPRPAFVVKQELLRVPIFGPWLRATGAIALDRNAGPRALRRLKEEAAERLAGQDQLVIFPEGTRVAPGAKAAFLPGVAGVYRGANAPVTPVAHNSGEHWLHPGPEKIPGGIILRFLPPIPADFDRRAFLGELKTRIDAARPDLASSTATVGHGGAAEPTVARQA
ncbi:MAG: lysophospholipid acyltransferase family protein [Pseudomonadota bacterium]